MRKCAYSSCIVFRQKNNWKCDSEELLERKLVVYFVLRKRFFRKEFNLELRNVFICIVRRIVSCLHARNWNRKGFVCLQ